MTLSLDGLTVVVGENGTGKSTIIEALELLEQARKGPHEPHEPPR